MQQDLKRLPLTFHLCIAQPAPEQEAELEANRLQYALRKAIDDGVAPTSNAFLSLVDDRKNENNTR